MTPTFFLLLIIGAIVSVLLYAIYDEQHRKRDILKRVLKEGQDTNKFLYVIADLSISSAKREIAKEKEELAEEQKKLEAEIEELKEQLRKKYEGGN